MQNVSEQGARAGGSKQKRFTHLRSRRWSSAAREGVRREERASGPGAFGLATYQDALRLLRLRPHLGEEAASRVVGREVLLHEVLDRTVEERVDMRYPSRSSLKTTKSFRNCIAISTTRPACEGGKGGHGGPGEGVRSGVPPASCSSRRSR